MVNMKDYEMKEELINLSKVESRQDSVTRLCLVVPQSSLKANTVGT